MKRYTLAVAALLVLVPWHESVRADAPLYTVQNLGSFKGEVPSIIGVNASGQVVGNVSTNGSMAVRYTGDAWQSLPGLDTAFSAATGINASGDVVGYHFTAGGQLLAFRYHGGAVEDISPLPGGSMTLGFGINDDGVVTGYADTAGGAVVPFVAAGTVPNARPSLNGTMAYGCGINATGQIAGVSTVTSGAQHAIRVDPAALAPIDIQSLDGESLTVNACAIDAAGHVAGQMTRATGQTHAFRYTDGTGVADLDTFGSTVSNVESIAAGVSAGWYTLPDGAHTHAFTHSDANGSVDLNTRIDPAGWVLGTAKAINESGMIAGEGTLNGQAAVYMLTPQQATDTTPPVINSVSASPSSIFPPTGQAVPVALTVNATDDSGQAPTCSISGVSGSPADHTVTGPLTGTVVAVGGRTYTFSVTCVDAANNTSQPASADVVVVADTTAPVIASVSATPNNVWPPDNRLVPVTVAVSATDDVDAVPACALTNISGVVAADDATITGPLAATLRAAGGRTYTLSVKCSDTAGNSSNGSTTVVVPPDTTAPAIASVSATPNSLWPPDGRLVPVSVTVSATDNVDAVPVCSLTGITGAPAGGDNAVITPPLSATLRAIGGTTYSLTVRCTDAAGNASTASASVVVPADTTAPSITSLSATPALIWPANGKWVSVSVAVSATDDVDASPVCALSAITGGPAADAAITGPFNAKVRAVRNADGSVRTYLLEVSCHDKAGNTSRAAVSVTVSKDGVQKVYHYNWRLQRFIEGLHWAYGRPR